MKTPASNPVTAFIEQALRRWDYAPEEINSGLCDAFADTIRQEVPGAEVACGPWHVFTVYQGRYYDAEAPAGVDDPRDLPFYARLNVSVEDWAWERWRITEGGITQDPHVRDEHFPPEQYDGVIARYRL